MKSTLWSVNARDWFKGFIMFFGTPLATLLQQGIPEWTPWLTSHLGATGALIVQGAIGAFATYMLKNISTDSTKEAVKTLSDQNVSIIEGSSVDEAKPSKSTTKITVFPQKNK